MEPLLPFVLGCLVVAAGLGFAYKLYRDQPTSGYYNRSAEKRRAAQRHRVNQWDINLILLIVGAGVLLLALALG